MSLWQTSFVTEIGFYFARRILPEMRYDNQMESASASLLICEKVIIFENAEKLWKKLTYIEKSVIYIFLK